MKVYELMSLLGNYPANTEICINVHGTSNTKITDVEMSFGQIIISGDDAFLLDDDGEPTDVPVSQLEICEK